ncbi:MAG: tetratricopeptide repeat protein [Cyclobacteriaceae bacterium]
MKTVTLLLLVSVFANSQKANAQLFDSDENKALIKEAARYIYRSDQTNSEIAIRRVAAKLPEHPVVPLMEAVFILWREMPMHTSDSIFLVFEDKLREVIDKSQNLPDKLKAEKIFFEMSARGFLAEHYADEGAYMKAFGEAHKTYGFMKDGFGMVDKAPEFLLTSGLYNYFRVAYPEKHPAYKPLLWFFKGGDKQKGIHQLERAVDETIISKVEANLYLSYIYLRYERKPEKAAAYLGNLFKSYPENKYFRAKYVEALIETGKYSNIPVLIAPLQESNKEYYQMAAEVFMGIYYEKHLKKQSFATENYQKAIDRIDRLRGQGYHIISWAYLGLGRTLRESNKDQAREAFRKAKDYSETDWVKQEAEDYLDKL